MLIRKVNAKVVNEVYGLPKKGKKKTTTRAFIFIDCSCWSGKSIRSMGRQIKGQEKDNLHFYADLESQHGRWVTEKRTRKRQQLTLLRWSGKSTQSTGRQKKRTRERQNSVLLRWSRKSTRLTGHQKRTRKRQQLALLYSSIKSGK